MYHEPSNYDLNSTCSTPNTMHQAIVVQREEKSEDMSTKYKYCSYDIRY